jgi:hypothetical protein
VDQPGEATVTIKDSGSSDTLYCLCTCSCVTAQFGVNENDGGVAMYVNPPGIIYFSKDNPHPIVTTDVPLQTT